MYFLIVSLKKTAQVISQIDVTQNLVIVDFVKKDGYPMILRRDTDETPIICELKSMVFDDPLLSLDVRIDRNLSIRLRYLP